jgi:hypothetical protein
MLKINNKKSIILKRILPLMNRKNKKKLEVIFIKFYGRFNIKDKKKIS